MKIRGFCCLPLCLVFIQLNFVECANILGIFATPVSSHQSFFRLIWKELALRGHNMTVLATKPLNDPNIKNLREIDLGFSFKILDDLNLVEEAQKTRDIFKLWTFVVNGLKHMTEMQLQHPPVQELIKDNNTHFDIVLTEFALPAYSYMSELFNCPLVVMTSMAANFITMSAIGNPVHPLVSPDANLPFGKKLNYKERLISVMHRIWANNYAHDVLYSYNGEVVKKFFGVEADLAETEKKRISLIIANDVPEISNIHARMPNVIEVHGIHLTPPAPLPQDLKEFLDNGTEGVIYFSFGTLVLPEKVKDKLQLMAEIFSELPYKVLWKLDVNDVTVNTKNVLVRPYFKSQQDILRHPNVKLFITQGGLHSLEEAIAYHVPIVGMPFIGDQRSNVKKMVESGMGVELNLKEATKEDIKSAIIEVINNPSYLERVKEVSKYAFDRPMKPMDEIVWWIEYVIRHKGAYHLRSPYFSLSWNEYYLVDIFLTFSILGVTILYIFYKLCKTVVNKTIELKESTKKKTE